MAGSSGAGTNSFLLVLLREKIRLFTRNKGYIEPSKLFVEKVRLQRVAAELHRLSFTRKRSFRIIRDGDRLLRA